MHWEQSGLRATGLRDELAVEWTGIVHEMDQEISWKLCSGIGLRDRPKQCSRGGLGDKVRNCPGIGLGTELEENLS